MTFLRLAFSIILFVPLASRGQISFARARTAQFSNARLCSNLFATNLLSMSEQPLWQNLSEVFERSYYDVKEIYSPFQCHYNVVRLLQQILKTNAQLETKDFSYLIIGRSSGIKILGDDPSKNFHVMNARRNYNKRLHTRFTNWSYHVVLLFRDLVLDLDYFYEPKIVSRKDYFRSMFIDSATVQEFEGRLYGPVDQLLVWRLSTIDFRPNEILWYSENHHGQPLSDWQ